MPDSPEILARLGRIEAKLDRILEKFGLATQSAEAHAKPQIAAAPSGWPNDVALPVHFANAQWAATRLGIEHMGEVGVYCIEAARVAETRHGSDLYHFPLHMAEKPWVDIDAFNEAFEVALRRFSPREFDADRLARSFAEARRPSSSR